MTSLCISEASEIGHIRCDIRANSQYPFAVCSYLKVNKFCLLIFNVWESVKKNMNLFKLKNPISVFLCSCWILNRSKNGDRLLINRSASCWTIFGFLKGKSSSKVLNLYSIRNDHFFSILYDHVCFFCLLYAAIWVAVKLSFNYRLDIILHHFYLYKEFDLWLIFN